jgi:hypothetical protein
MMLVPAALFLAANASAGSADNVRAETLLRSAEDARFAAAVTLCGDAGRGAQFRRLAAEQRRLERAFREKAGRWAITDIVMDDRGDCQSPDSFRRQINRYQLAVDDARDAMGMEQ